MTTITYLAAGLTMIGVLVVIHEFGHFLFAKLFGVGVPVFSVGMGPRLFGFVYNGTDYRISALPIGGYVLMAGADPFGEEDRSQQPDPDLDFMQKPVWQRLIVMVAGPAFNLILPVLVFTAVLMSGKPQAAPWVGLVLENSPADRIGIETGDVIVSVDGDPVEVFADVYERLRDDPSVALTLGVKRGEETFTTVLPGNSAKHTFDGYVDFLSVGIAAYSRSTRVGVDDPNSPFGVAGIVTGDAIVAIDGVDLERWEDLVVGMTGSTHELDVLHLVDGKPERIKRTVTREGWQAAEYDPWGNAWGFAPATVYVGTVTTDSAAGDAGLRPLDRLVSLDDEPVLYWNQLHAMVGASMDGRTEEQGPRSIDLVVVRDDERVSVTLTPRVERETVRGSVRYRPIMGVAPMSDAFVSGKIAHKYYTFSEAVPRAFDQSKDIVSSIFGVLGRFGQGQLYPQEVFGGPLKIFAAAGESARDGIHSFAEMLGTISFSLGIVNLLPLPVLDGGQIVFYTIEWIRGRPVSVRIRERVQIIGGLGLITFMLLITLADAADLFG